MTGVCFVVGVDGRGPRVADGLQERVVGAIAGVASHSRSP